MAWFTRRWRRTAEERSQVSSITRPFAPPAREVEERSYIFGENEGEISRLDLQHYMFRWEFGGDFMAPLNAPRNILDVACGTRRRAREMPRRFPQAAVFGFDINQQQLEACLAEGERSGADYLPSNCTFLTGNALEPFKIGR